MSREWKYDFSGWSQIETDVFQPDQELEISLHEAGFRLNADFTFGDATFEVRVHVKELGDPESGGGPAEEYWVCLGGAEYSRLVFVQGFPALIELLAKLAPIAYSALLTERLNERRERAANQRKQRKGKR